MDQWSLGEVLNCMVWCREPFRDEQYDKRGLVMCLLAILLKVQLYIKLKSRYKTYWRIKFGGSLKKSPNLIPCHIFCLYGM